MVCIANVVSTAVMNMVLSDAMNADSLEILLKCDFLYGLFARCATGISGCRSQRHIEPGVFCLIRMNRQLSFTLLLSGIVRLAQVTPEGHQVIVHHVTPGEGIGIIVVLSNMPYPVSAETLEACVLLSYDAETTRQLMLQYPNWRSMEWNWLLNILYRFPLVFANWLPACRKAHRPCHFAARAGRLASDRRRYLARCPLSRQDLAEMTGTTSTRPVVFCRNGKNKAGSKLVANK